MTTGLCCMSCQQQSVNSVRAEFYYLLFTVPAGALFPWGQAGMWTPLQAGRPPFSRGSTFPFQPRTQSRSVSCAREEAFHIPLICCPFALLRWMLLLLPSVFLDGTPVYSSFMYFCATSDHENTGGFL